MKPRILAGFTSALVVLLFSASPSAVPPYGPWGAPVNLGGVVNSTGGDFFPAISKDGLSLYFAAQSCPSNGFCRPGFGGWDIYVTQRPSLDEPWGPPQNLGSDVNTSSDEVSPDLSRDGHRLFFASNRPGGFGGNDIYMARRRDKRDDFAWQAPINLGDGVNSATNDAGPSIFEDDANDTATLYFDSNRPEGFGPFTDDTVHNGNDIYASVLQPNGAFGSATLVSELSTPAADRSPAIRRDGLEILITSNRSDGRIGLLDLWVATRESIYEPWSTPTNLGSVINGPNQQAGAALSFDGHTLYFQASALSHPGFGNYDLFAATRSKLTMSQKGK
jgi:hypothetical protein